jgi:hypothetical protein
MRLPPSTPDTQEATNKPEHHRQAQQLLINGDHFRLAGPRNHCIIVVLQTGTDVNALQRTRQHGVNTERDCPPLA